VVVGARHGISNLNRHFGREISLYEPLLPASDVARRYVRPWGRACLCQSYRHERTSLTMNPKTGKLKTLVTPKAGQPQWIGI